MSWDETVETMRQLVAAQALEGDARLERELQILNTQQGERIAAQALADEAYERHNFAAAALGDDRRLEGLKAWGYTWREVCTNVALFCAEKAFADERLAQLTHDELERLAASVETELRMREGLDAEIDAAFLVDRQATCTAYTVNLEHELPAWVVDLEPDDGHLDPLAPSRVRFVFWDGSQLIFARHPHEVNRWRQVLAEEELPGSQVAEGHFDPVVRSQQEAEAEEVADQIRSLDATIRYLGQGLPADERDRLGEELEEAKAAADLPRLFELERQVMARKNYLKAAAKRRAEIESERSPETADNGVVPPVSGASGAAS